jgi:hypothetical protein
MIETKGAWASNFAQRSLQSASILCTKDQTSDGKSFKRLYVVTTRNSLPLDAGDEAALVAGMVEEVDMAENEEGTLHYQRCQHW